MKYAVWFVRLVFAAWMIPAGLNHFIYLFPQPMGDQPLSTELITALLDSHMFDITKTVELLAGLCVLFGFYAPLALIVCLPVSFCVWFWDVPLQGWTSGSAVYGWAVLLEQPVPVRGPFRILPPDVRSALHAARSRDPPLVAQAGSRSMKPSSSSPACLRSLDACERHQPFRLAAWPEPTAPSRSRSS